MAPMNNKTKKKAEERKQIQKKMKGNIQGANSIPKPIYVLPEIMEARKRTRAKFKENVKKGLKQKNTTKKTTKK